jgi:cell division protein FtsB
MAKRPQLTGRAAILAVVVCAIAMSLAYPVREVVSQRRSIAQLQSDKQRELEKQHQLQERSRQLADPGYVKREARRRLHYCGAGEKCFVVMDEQQRKNGRPPVAQRTEAGPPWYQTLWESVEAADTGTGQRAVTGEKNGSG